MPIQVEIRHAGAGIILNCSGILGVDDFHRANQSILDRGKDLRKWLYSIVDLTFVVGAINLWNRLAISMRALPGHYKPAKSASGASS